MILHHVTKIPCPGCQWARSLTTALIYGVGARLHCVARVRHLSYEIVGFTCAHQQWLEKLWTVTFYHFRRHKGSFEWAETLLPFAPSPSKAPFQTVLWAILSYFMRQALPQKPSLTIIRIETTRLIICMMLNKKHASSFEIYTTFPIFV